MKPNCKIPDCQRAARAKGMCDTHYRRVARTGTVANCQIPGCERPFRALGYCAVHYQRQLRHGDPLFGGAIAQDAIGPPPSLPVQPLLDYIEAQGGLTACLDAAGFLGQERDNVGQALDRAKRRQARTIPVATADDIIIRVFGVHPFAVYGDAWWTEEEGAMAA